MRLLRRRIKDVDCSQIKWFPLTLNQHTPIMQLKSNEYIYIFFVTNEYIYKPLLKIIDGGFFCINKHKIFIQKVQERGKSETIN